MVPVLITPPANLPVALEDLRQHLRIDHADDDVLITELAAAAVGHLDGFAGVLGRAILRQTWAEEWNCPGPYLLALPDVDLDSLDITADGVEVAGADISTELTAAGLVVTLSGAYGLPVRIEYACALPAAQRATVNVVIKMLVAHWYANRETVGDAAVEMPLAATALITPLRRVRL
jgi:hypothetical protein